MRFNILPALIFAAAITIGITHRDNMNRIRSVESLSIQEQGTQIVFEEEGILVIASK